tara:strand:- start:12301 stop:13344 length:1044 start_codon:yes stop_codon:yes gene_type:complete
MKPFAILLSIIIFFSCKNQDESVPRKISKVEIETLLEDSLLSIRAIEILNDGNLAFAASKGVYGMYDQRKKMWQTSAQRHDSLDLQFRAVGHTATDFFMLSIASPALLYRTGNAGKMELVYKEEADTVFYDSMDFWNDLEGIAIGDSLGGCLSIIITRDGGETWTKLSCENLPKAEEGEGAFAASDTNIAIVGNKAWVATTHGNVYCSSDKGISWEVIKTPMIQDEPTEGIYSIAFYDEQNGFAIGGNYTKPDNNVANKMRTTDGGKTWKLVANGQTPNFRSCVQYMPNRNGKELAAIGFKGIDFSDDSGESWKHLSDEGFYTIRFLNDSVAYAAGAGRISKLTFRE